MNKKLFTKLIVICLAVAIVFSLAGCSMATVNEDRQKTQPVAVVNGTDITWLDYDNLLTQYLYSYYGYSEEQYLQLGDESLESIQGIVMKELVARELEYQDALEKGYALSDEEVAALEQAFNDEIANLETNYRGLLELNGSYTEEEMDKMVEEYVAYQKGEDFDWDREFAWICKEQVIGNYEQDIIDGVELTEESMKTYYEANVDNQLTALENDMYEMLMSFGGTIYVYPEDVRAVHHILIGFDEDTKTEIANARSYGEEGEADKLREEALKDIQKEADEVMAVIEAEEDMTTERFLELMEEYSDDEGSLTEENKDGYIVHSYTNNFVPEFTEAAMGLKKEGEVTVLVPSDYGYHIIRLASFPDQYRPFEEIKDELYTELIRMEQNTAIEANKAALLDKADVTYHYDRIKVPGQR